MEKPQFSTGVQLLLDQKPQWWMMFGNYFILLFTAGIIAFLASIKTDNISRYAVKKESNAGIAFFNLPLTASMEQELNSENTGVFIEFPATSVDVELTGGQYAIKNTGDKHKVLQINLDKMPQFKDLENAVIITKETDVSFLKALSRYLFSGI